MDVDDSGYFRNAPIHPSNWRRLAPDEPDGKVMTLNSVPPGVLLVEGFLTPTLSQRVVNACAAAPRAPNRIFDNQKSSSPQISAGRLSDYIDSADVAGVDLAKLARLAYSNLIIPHFGRQIESIERPEILRYEVGGEYKPHADADNWDGEGKVWRRTLDRDYSMLLYLNDDFEGGEIVFPNFGVSIRPKPGLLLAFPSDYRYLHAARPVTRGVKFVLVAWAKAAGSLQVETLRRPAVEAF